MLIRSGGGGVYLFSKLFFNLAADIFSDLLNIWTRWLASEFGPNSLFLYIVLRKFSHNKLKLAVAYLVVGKCFGKQPVNRVAFRNCKSHNLLMFLNFRAKLFAGDYQTRGNESESAADAIKRDCRRQADNRQSRAETRA